MRSGIYVLLVVIISAMEYAIFIIILALLKESHPLNPEILKYDQYMKDFEVTGRRIKQEAKDQKMDGLVMKRENPSLDPQEVKRYKEDFNRIWYPQTEANPIRDKDDLKQRAQEAADTWKVVQKALFSPKPTERDYEKEEWLKKKRTGSVAFSQIPDVDIDSYGVFKYVLIELTDKDGKKRNVVRGYKRFAFHDAIFQDLQEDVGPRFGVKCRCLGGGEIDHQPDEKFMKVYGYSESYGRANHQEAVEILKSEYKDYQIVWTSNRK